MKNEFEIVYKEAKPTKKIFGKDLYRGQIARVAVTGYLVIRAEDSLIFLADGSGDSI